MNAVIVVILLSVLIAAIIRSYLWCKQIENSTVNMLDSMYEIDKALKDVKDILEDLKS